MRQTFLASASAFALAFALTPHRAAADSAIRFTPTAFAHVSTEERLGFWGGALLETAIAARGRILFEHGAAYAAAGTSPGDGTNELSLVGGLRLDLGRGDRPSYFGRLLGGYSPVVGGQRRDETPRVLAVTQAGAMIGPLDAFLSVGIGPAAGLSFGVGIGLRLPPD
jgi:hypothetical protein